MERLLFLKKFFQFGSERLGSIAPSSRWFAAEQTRHVTPDKPQVIVELGAGTGAVTRKIADKMHPQSTLIAIEIDSDFARVLARKVPEAQVIVGDVVAALDCLVVSQIDLMICALPLPQLPLASTTKVFQVLQDLGHKDTVLTQPTLIPKTYKKIYTELFHSVMTKRVLMNIPPGGVFHCKSLKTNYHLHLPGREC